MAISNDQSLQSLKEAISVLTVKLDERFNLVDEKFKGVENQLKGLDKRLEKIENSQKAQIWTLIGIVATATLGVTGALITLLIRSSLFNIA